MASLSYQLTPNGGSATAMRPGISYQYNAVFLPHVMSRKKQIVPRLSELWG